MKPLSFLLTVLPHCTVAGPFRMVYESLTVSSTWRLLVVVKLASTSWHRLGYKYATVGVTNSEQSPATGSATGCATQCYYTVVVVAADMSRCGNRLRILSLGDVPSSKCSRLLRVPTSFYDTFHPNDILHDRLPRRCRQWLLLRMYHRGLLQRRGANSRKFRLPIILIGIERVSPLSCHGPSVVRMHWQCYLSATVSDVRSRPLVSQHTHELALRVGRLPLLLESTVGSTRGSYAFLRVQVLGIHDRRA